MSEFLLFLVGVAATVAVGFWFRPKATLPKMLSVVSHEIPLIRVEDDVSDSISVTFNGESIDGITRVRAYAWNSGGTEISGSDIATADPLRIGIDCGQLISNPIVEVSRPSVAAQTAEMQAGLLISFDLLDLDDWIKIEFLLNKQQASSEKPRIEGVIAGIPSGIQSLHMRDMYRAKAVEYSLGSRRKSFKREIYLFSSLFLVCIASVSLPQMFPIFEVPENITIGLITIAVLSLCALFINVWALRRTFSKQSPMEKFRSPPWIDEETSGEDGRK